MTLNSPLSVRVEQPGKSFGTAMNEIRSWLGFQDLSAHKLAERERVRLVQRCPVGRTR